MSVAHLALKKLYDLSSTRLLQSMVITVSLSEKYTCRKVRNLIVVWEENNMSPVRAVVLVRYSQVVHHLVENSSLSIRNVAKISTNNILACTLELYLEF